MNPNTLRPLILAIPLCLAVVVVAAFLHGTWAYIAGGLVVGVFVLLGLPAVLSRPRWRQQEQDAEPGAHRADEEARPPVADGVEAVERAAGLDGAGLERRWLCGYVAFGGAAGLCFALLRSGVTGSATLTRVQG